MTELFAWRPDAVANTIRIADQCEVALPMPGDVTPRYSVPEGRGDADAYLRHLTYKGGAARYGKFTEKILRRVEHELSVITKLGYADFFLMCWEIVRWARKQGIRATGRGSAADSCVAYCLTLTDVDVIRRNLPFARFLTEGKNPDIDMDFPSERRDDVFRYIVEKYGEAHVGMVCTFHTYWAKGAVRDIGKALSIPPDALEWLSDNLSGFIDADRLEEAFTRYAELRPHAAIRDRFKLLFQCAAKIAGFPRHIGTHSSGIVISRLPLADIAPLQPSARGITQIWELDKDDAESIGAIKFDVLSLRMLSAVVDAEKNIRAEETRKWENEELPCDRKSKIENRKFSYDRIPFNDPDTFRMIRAGKAVGTFQFESAAQMALAATLNPEHFEDLVAAVALIRPGPIQGHVVQRFVACRNGWMRADIIHPALAITLSKTYGCIVFQEQVNDVVAIMTGCTDAEADRFRKSITQHTKMGTMQSLREEFVKRSCAYHRDFDEERANRLFDQIQGWAGYGFTEGHAASFALLGYRSAYMSVHHPAELFAGLMNHQPMGFFNANTLAGEARRRGVPVLPVDINASGDKCVAVEEEDPQEEAWVSRDTSGYHDFRGNLGPEAPGDSTNCSMQNLPTPYNKRVDMHVWPRSNRAALPRGALGTKIMRPPGI
jgi:error-prone DNA polymerase